MASATGNRNPAQFFALMFGLVYLGVGIAGFSVTGFDDFAGETFDDKLLVFALNPLHNIVHLGLGVGWVVASFKPDPAKKVNLLFGVVLGLVTALGLAGVLQWLAIEEANSPDNFLHLATSLLALYFGSAGAEGPSGSVDI